MSDSGTKDLGGVERDSTERDFSGVSCGVSLGKHIDGSDLTDVEDDDSGSVESEASMFIRTSVHGVPVAVHDTGAKGMSVVLFVDRLSCGLTFEFPGDD